MISYKECSGKNNPIIIWYDVLINIIEGMTFNHIEHILIKTFIHNDGWMVCNFQVGEHQYRLQMEAIFHDPLQDIKRMLEEISYSSFNRSTISLFQEGIEYRLSYIPISLEYGIFSIEWRNTFEDDSPYTIGCSVTVERDTFVRAFYTSIIDFYLSGEYESKANEAFTLQEIFEQKFGRSILSFEVMNALFSYEKKELELLFLAISNEFVESFNIVTLKDQFDRLIRIAIENEVYYNDMFYWWEWETDAFVSENEKRETIIKAIETPQHCYGFRLTDFKSLIIEDFLLGKSLKGAIEYDSIYFGFNEEDAKELRFYVMINGEDVFEKFFLDIFELWESVAKSGEYQLFVCGCGSEGCAGIFKSPKVNVDDDTVIWEIFEPERYIFRFRQSCIRSAVAELKVQMLGNRSLDIWKNTQYLFQSGIDEFLEDFFIDECGE